MAPLNEEVRERRSPSNPEETTPPVPVSSDSLKRNVNGDVILEEDDDVVVQLPPRPYKMQYAWKNIALYIVLHTAALYGLYLALFKAKWATLLWSYFLAQIGLLGITAGVHRLWSHKTYKATWPLKLILVIFNSVAFQTDVIEWARDHRAHHKFTDTNGDPMNVKRGFFFSHIGWQMVRKHPDVKEQGSKLDVDDLLAEPLLMFQRRHYKYLVAFFCFFLPTVVPHLWGEQYYTAFYVAGILRFTYTLHVTLSLGSLGHMWGYRPYDKNITSRQNPLISLCTLGEGWHNYHHAFPSDYRTSEFPYLINPTTLFIDFFKLIGWAYDTKKISKEAVERRKLKTGEYLPKFAF